MPPATLAGGIPLPLDIAGNGAHHPLGCAIYLANSAHFAREHTLGSMGHYAAHPILIEKMADAV